jgi:hypothetical protein
MKSLQKPPVAERWVVNASPVIALARIGQVELLTALPKQAVIPRAVADELMHASEDDPARRKWTIQNHQNAYAVCGHPCLGFGIWRKRRVILRIGASTVGCGIRPPLNVQRGDNHY